MALPRGDTPEQLIEDLVASEAPAETGEAIVEALLSAGLSTTEARDWIAHPNRAYPHDWPTEIAGTVLELKAGSMWLFTQGHAMTVLADAREFAAAAADERTIARLFGGNIEDARRLTGRDPTRAAVIAEIDPRQLLESEDLMFTGW